MVNTNSRREEFHTFTINTINFMLLIFHSCTLHNIKMQNKISEQIETLTETECTNFGL